MSDAKTLRPVTDRDRVATSQAYEVEVLASRFRLSRPIVVHAIQKRGPLRADVEAYLASLRAAS